MAEISCTECGKSFSRKRSDKVTCSAACRSRSYRRRYPEKCKAQVKAWADANREHLKEYQRNRYPHVREKLIAQRRLNREAESARFKAWYRKNKEHRQNYAKEWREANREKTRLYNHNREALERAAFSIKFTPEELSKKIQYWGDCCWMCEGPWDSLDHVKPLVKGGSHILANIRPACKSCNSSKSSKWEGVGGLHVFKK